MNGSHSGNRACWRAHAGLCVRRPQAALLAVAGIALESARDVLAHRRLHYVVLATVASFFFDQDKQERAAEFARLEERLARLETKQDQVLQAVTRYQEEPL
jgi:hypothetical protein